jgi:diguanylate cyclase (GGDEF)-like protein
MKNNNPRIRWIESSAHQFRRKYLALIAITWILPPVIGLSVIVYTRIFSFEQLLKIMVTPLEPIFVTAYAVFALWYFDRLSQPLTNYLDKPRQQDAAMVNRCLQRFPLHFWLFFIAYLLIAAAVTITSAELYTGFSPQPVDWFRINLVALIVSIIVGLPLFFSIFDLFGKYFGSVILPQPVVTIKTRVFLIGALVPLLIDTMLVQYYWSRTGYFSTETFFIWLFLEVIAVAGALLFVRSFGQSLSPLEVLIRAPRGPEAVPSGSLVPASTDELGKLSQDIRALMEEQQVHRERLSLSNQLLKTFKSSEDMSTLVGVIIESTRTRVGGDVCVLAFYDEQEDKLAVVIHTGAEYRSEGYDHIPLDEPSIFREVFKSGEICVIEDTVNDARVNRKIIDRFGFRSIAGAPLSSGGKTVGILVCGYCSEFHHFSAQQLNILHAFAQEAALIELFARDLYENKRAEHAIMQIMMGISTATGERFFPAVAETMCEILNADAVVIGVLSEHSDEHIDTLAFYADGKAMPNTSYKFVGHPCETIIGNTAHSFTSGIQQLFPADKQLQSMNIEAYIGAPLFDSHNTRLGIQFAMFRKPVKDPLFIESVLRIFASRTSAEIERARIEQQIKHMAYHDSLTKLPNRELLLDRLHQSLSHAQRNCNYLAVLMLDLDHFKAINDSLGHPVGDELLTGVAQRLSDCIRKEDTAARLGGDEFVILLTDLGDQDNALKHSTLIADKIREKLKPIYAINGNNLIITPSIGIALFPDDGDTPELLLKHADTALYQAKEQGRNNYQFFSPAMNAAAVKRMEVESDLREALAHEHFWLAYQPKASISDHRIIGAEVLLRWSHPQKGNIPPVGFISIAEETGLIIPLGDWVMQATCNMAASIWCLHGHCNNSNRLSFNVSPLQFRQHDFVDKLKLALERSKAQPCCIEIELTENVLIHDINLVSQKLDELKELGIHISIDDFGTGYSSLSYLQKLPIDTIKIDRSFVRNIAHKSSDAAIVETIIAMARHMDMQTIAEGVEDIDQLALLTGYGCEAYQGFLYSKPVSADDFMQLIAQPASPGRLLGS